MGPSALYEAQFSDRYTGASGFVREIRRRCVVEGARVVIATLPAIN